MSVLTNVGGYPYLVPMQQGTSKAAQITRTIVRIVFATALIVGLSLFLGYAPIWSGLVIILCMVALVAIFHKQLDT